MLNMFKPFALLLISVSLVYCAVRQCKPHIPIPTEMRITSCPDLDNDKPCDVHVGEDLFIFGVYRVDSCRNMKAYFVFNQLQTHVVDLGPVVAPGEISLNISGIIMPKYPKGPNMFQMKLVGDSEYVCAVIDINVV